MAKIVKFSTTTHQIILKNSADSSQNLVQEVFGLNSEKLRAIIWLERGVNCYTATDVLKVRHWCALKQHLSAMSQL